MPPNDVAIKISAQNEALKELEKARAEITRLTETARRDLGQNFPRAARASTESAGKLREGLQAVAFQAAGIDGPIGKLSSTLLSFGAGSTLVLAATAGVGAVALAMRTMVGPATAAREASEKFAKSLQGAISVAQQFRDLEAASAAARAESMSRIQAVSASSPIGPVLGLAGGAQVRAESEAEQAARVEAALGLRGQRLGSADKEIQAAERATQLLGLEADEVARLTAEWRGYTQQQTERFVADARKREQRLQEIAELKAVRELLEEFERIQAGIRFPTADELAGLPIGVPKFADTAVTERAKEQAGLGFFKEAGKDVAGVRAFERALHDSAEAARAAALAHQQSAVAIVGAASGLFSAIAGGGGAGGILSAGGGLLTQLGSLTTASGALAFPGLGMLPGAIVTGLGGVVSSLFGGGGAKVTIDSYTQKALDQQRAQDESKRNVIILQVVDAQGRVRDQIYDITRYQNRGGTAGGITARSDGGAVTTRSG
jgi:hypothetical protein